MSLDGQGPDPTLAARGILPVGPRQPEMESADSLQTDSVETDAYAFENRCRPEPIRVYAAGVSMADHHASLACTPSLRGQRTPVRGRIPCILLQIPRALLQSSRYKLQFLYLHNLYLQIVQLQHRHFR